MAVSIEELRGKDNKILFDTKKSVKGKRPRRRTRLFDQRRKSYGLSWAGE